jgi:TolB-like protein/DNA-binding winged helix-turn-helix (wHTH) protein/Tfp pilus assembly protein PilF
MQHLRVAKEGEDGYYSATSSAGSAILPASLYQFEGFELDLKRFELRRNGQALKLERIPMELLILLVSRNGDLVSREEIVEKLWGKNVFIEAEHSVNTAIRKIRQALEDDPDNPRFVKTVVGKGYRFSAAVRSCEPESISAATEPNGPPPTVRSEKAPDPMLWLWVTATAVAMLIGIAFLGNLGGMRDRVLGRSPAGQINSLAVIPLENLSGDKSQEFFADGMTDELITDLAQNSTLRVISRTSVMRYKGTRKPLPQIANELGVDAIVEGTIERAGDRVRIRAQLIRASDDRHLWADTFERELPDILGLESEVASSIARQVQTRLASGHPPSNRKVQPAAYEAYLKGRYAWNKRSEAALFEGIEFFKQAITLEPDYGEAYSGLADSYTTLGYLSYIAPRDAFPLARAAAEKALVLNGSLAEPHASLAYVCFYYDWNWPAAEIEFKKAITLNPNYATVHEWYSIYLTAMLRPDEAKTEIDRALQLDPLSLIINTDVGFQMFYAKKYDEAILQLKKTLQMGPRFPLAHLWLGRAYQQKGMFDEAMNEYGATENALPGWIVTLAGIGNLQGLFGKDADARATLAKLKELSKNEYVTPYGVALVYAGLGDKQQAFQWLETAVSDRSHWLAWIRLDPRWESLRSDPRYADLVRRIGFLN